MKKEDVWWAVGVVRDLTDVYDNMLELTKLSSAVKYSQDIVFITDDRGTIEYVNPSFTRITGYSEEEAVGKKPSIISYFNKGKRLFPEIIKAINSKGIYSKVVFNKKERWRSFLL